MATAFPLIVILLAQGELSCDQAHTEQFTSLPIQTAAVFAGGLRDSMTNHLQISFNADIKKEPSLSGQCPATLCTWLAPNSNVNTPASLLGTPNN